MAEKCEPLRHGVQTTSHFPPPIYRQPTQSDRLFVRYFYLSEVSGPVYGRPAVESVLNRKVGWVWGAVKERAQGTDVSISASSVEREAAVQHLLARESRLHSQRHGNKTGVKKKEKESDWQ